MSRLHTALRRSAAVAGLSCGVGWAAVGTPAARAETAGGWDFAAGEKKKKVGRPSDPLPPAPLLPAHTRPRPCYCRVVVPPPLRN